MSESVNFIQGRKEQYNPSEMQGGLFFSKDSKEILLNGESYGNATPADEEDITAEDGNLKLKDRAYDEASFSGKGYKILRKNIVEGKNILTQDMINEPNTVYEIRYDFDLNGATISIPEECVLKFDGGSINNGLINFNHCIISSDYPCIYTDFAETSGNYIGNNEIEAKIFGILPDEEDLPSGIRLNKLIQHVIGTIVLSNGEYYIEQPIRVKSVCFIKGIDNTEINTGTYFIPINNFNTTYPNRGVIESWNYNWDSSQSSKPDYAHNLSIKNISIKNTKSEYDFGVVIWCAGEHCIVENVGVNYATKAGFYYGGYMAVGRIIRCSSWNTPVGYLFDQHQNPDFAPGIDAASGGNGNGGSCSMLECSGDNYDTACVKVTGTQNIAIYSQKSEQVEHFIEIKNNLTGNNVPSIMVLGSRIEFGRKNKKYLVHEIGSNSHCNLVLISNSCYNISGFLYNTERDLDYPFDNEVMHNFMYNDAGFSTYLYEGLNTDKYISLSDRLILKPTESLNSKNALVLQRNSALQTLFRDNDIPFLTRKLVQGEEMRLYSANVNHNYLLLDAASFGTTDNRQQYITSNDEYNLVPGFQYFDTTLDKPVYWNGTEWVTSDGLSVDSTGWALIE